MKNKKNSPFSDEKFSDEIVSDEKVSAEKEGKSEENSLKATVRRGLFYAALGLVAFGLAGGAVSLLLGFTKFENLKAAATVCFFLPIPLFLFLLLFEKKRKKKGEGKRFRTFLPLYAVPLVLYGVLFAVSFRMLPAGLFSLVLSSGSLSAAYFSGSLLLLRLFFTGFQCLLSLCQRESKEKTPDEPPGTDGRS